MSFKLTKNTSNKLWKIFNILALAIVILTYITSVNGTSTTSEIKGPIIGIDLGTSNSVVTIFKDNKCTVILNNQGNRITPSVVHLGNKTLVGDLAKNIMFEYPKNTIHQVKRFMGRQFNDKEVQNDIKLFPFDIINKKNKPHFKIKYDDDSIKTFSPEQIYGMILEKIKYIAENYLSEKIYNVVVTYPRYFDEQSRGAVRVACKIAGLNTIRFIHEPIAAAIAYGLNNKNNNGINVLVYDIGGGTYEISLLTLDEGVFEIIATAGNMHLGGEDFDDNIMKYFIEKFNNKIGLNINCDDIYCKKAMSKLKKEVEKAKIKLSSVKEVTINIKNLYNGNDFNEKLTRERFEDLNIKLFKDTLKPINQVLNDAMMSKSDINEIILVGGSTRIPKIQELLKQFFNGKEINKSIEPDEAIACGAGMIGGLLNPNKRWANGEEVDKDYLHGNISNNDDRSYHNEL